MNVRSLIYGFVGALEFWISEPRTLEDIGRLEDKVGMSLNVAGSILSERLFHTWKDPNRLIGDFQDFCDSWVPRFLSFLRSK